MKRPIRPADHMVLPDRIHKVMRMTRAGIPVEGDIREFHNRLWEEIKSLESELAATPVAFGELGAIRVATLKAEAFYQSGQTSKAVETLAPLWERFHSLLAPRADRVPPKGHGLLRQKLWALLHYIFYRFYALEGNYAQALIFLKKLRTVINRQLKRPSYRPAGTLALTYYVMGHCYRANRDFVKAEKCFLLAQVEGQYRIDKKLKEHTEMTKAHETAPTESSGEKESARVVDREYELGYNLVFTSRVLGAGLSWVATQEGRLVRGEQLARAAICILAGTGQESLRVLLESIVLVATRRRATFGSREESEVLRDLEGCYAKFAKCGDIPGQFRCASELVRGHLDRVEFLDTEKTGSLVAAKRWLDTLSKVCDVRKELRYRLQHSRFLLLSGDVSGALARLGKPPNPHVTEKNRDNANEHSEGKVTFENLAAAIYLEQGQTETARSRLNKSLSSLQAHSSRRGRRSLDPVLEAECHLLFAKAAILDGDFKGAKRHLGRWEAMSESVENNYLHVLGRRLRDRVGGDPFHLEFDFNVMKKSSKQYKEEFGKFIDDSIFRRFGSQSDMLAKALGIHRTNVKRRREKNGTIGQASDEPDSED